MTAYSPHHAFDVAPGEPQPSLGALFFRRVLRLLRRERAVPAVAAAGAATFADRFPCCVHCLSGSPCDPAGNHPTPCDDGCNAVLSDQMLAQVREQWDARHDEAPLSPPAAHANAVWQASEPYLPQRPRPGTLPAQKALVTRTPDAPPWETPTSVQPVIGGLPDAAQMRDEYFAAHAASGTLPTARELLDVIDGLKKMPPAPVYGERPVAEVLEAERGAHVPVKLPRVMS